MTIEFRELKQTFRRLGLYENHSYGWIYFRVFFCLMLSIFLIDYSILCSAICFGCYVQQIAFIGHDAGHDSVFREKKWNQYLGYLVGNVCSGIAMRWWNSTHRVHHVVSNSIEHDPDIQHLPLLACSNKIKPGYESSYHQTSAKWSPLLLRYQHLYFFPLMTVARFNLYIQSFLLCIQESRFFEIGLLVMYWIMFMSWLGTLSIWDQILFVWISHAVGGLLHVQILLSHYPMEVYHGIQHDWIHSQLSSTMNIKTSPHWDWFHGGLQFQIEHHLFPNIPRNHLRTVSTFLQPFCKKYDLPYHSFSFSKGLELLYHSLKEAGK